MFVKDRRRRAQLGPRRCSPPSGFCLPPSRPPICSASFTDAGRTASAASRHSTASRRGNGTAPHRTRRRSALTPTASEARDRSLPSSRPRCAICRNKWRSSSAHEADREGRWSRRHGAGRRRPSPPRRPRPSRCCRQKPAYQSKAPREARGRHPSPPTRPRGREQAPERAQARRAGQGAGQASRYAGDRAQPRRSTSAPSRGGAARR